MSGFIVYQQFVSLVFTRENIMLGQIGGSLQSTPHLAGSNECKQALRDIQKRVKNYIDTDIPPDSKLGRPCACLLTEPNKPLSPPIRPRSSARVTAFPERAQ
jgi:hypothetical protein